MRPEPGRCARLLLRAARGCASEAELGDIHEELVAGHRSGWWLLRQVLSIVSPTRSQVPLGRRRTAMLSDLWSDIRYTLRTLRRNPGFASATLVPIALGVGINTAVFSTLNNVAFQPLPASNANELVSVYQDFQGVQKRRVHGARMMFSAPEYRAYRDATRTLSGLAAYSRPWTFTLGGPAPQQLEGVSVTCNYFDVLQRRLSIGAGFTRAHCDAPGGLPEVVLTHALWASAFNADPGVVGRTITLDGQAAAIVGVGPEGFYGIDLQKAAFFASTTLEPALNEDAHLSWLALLGRRAPAADLAHVRAELALVAARIDRLEPGRRTTLDVAPATTVSLPVARRAFFNLAGVLLAAFALVLLIACANVSNVLLARAAGRTREVAIRLAVGASRARLVRQLLTESLTIALTGGMAGALLAWWSSQLLFTRLPSHLPGDAGAPRLDASPDLRVLCFGLGLTIVTALLCGVPSALQASNRDVHTAAREQGGSGLGVGWLRSTLIGVQVSVCMVLLVSAGLLLRALHAAHTVDPGFEHREVAVISYQFHAPVYDDARVATFQRQFLERIRSLPGVDGAGQVSKVPLSPGRQEASFRLNHQPEEIDVDVNQVSPDYFSVVGIPIVRGRTFTAVELEGAPRAVIVSEATSRRYWPGQDPVGRLIEMGGSELEVVGVAANAQVAGLGETDSPYMYLPAGAATQRGLRVLVRSRSDIAALVKAVTAAARELDPELVVQVRALDAGLEYWRVRSRLTAVLSGALSLLALVLALVGVYGVVAYVVSRRRRELGIRRALGATAGDVQRLILEQTSRPVAVGAAIGIAGAAATSRVLQAILFGISPFDPIAFIGAAAFLAGAALAAALLPTRAALRVDPATALRCE